VPPGSCTLTRCRGGGGELAGFPRCALGALPPPTCPMSSSSLTCQFLHIVLPVAPLMPVRRPCSQVCVGCDPSSAVEGDLCLMMHSSVHKHYWVRNIRWITCLYDDELKTVNILSLVLHWWLCLNTRTCQS
jgi:hypothetical protein